MSAAPAWPEPSLREKSPWRPSLSTAIGLVCFLGIIFSNWRLVLISADGDPCLHWRIGNWMIEHHHVLTAECFSHTRAGTAVITMEWLSQLAYATAGNLLGWNGFVLVAAALIAGTLWALHRLLLAEKCDDLLALLLVMLAALAMSHHWLARPHLFTHLILVGWVWELRAFDSGRHSATRLFLTLTPLLALWVNLHGGFLAGLILVGLFTVGNLTRPSVALPLAVLALVCVIASFANPNGWKLDAYLLEFFRQPSLAGYTNEFGPVNFHAGGMRGFLLLLGALTLLLVATRPRLRMLEVLLVAAWGYLALKYVRNVPVFTIVVTPILAVHGSDWLRRRQQETGRTTWHRLSARLTALRTSRGNPAWVTLALAIVLAVQARPGGLRTELLADRFPIAAVNRLQAEPELVRGEMFNAYGYGGYLIFALPERKVFIDGRNDLYGAAFLKEFDQVDEARPGWDVVLEKYKVGWTILPVAHRLNRVLELEPGWERVYGDDTTLIFRRK